MKSTKYFNLIIACLLMQYVGTGCESIESYDQVGIENGVIMNGVFSVSLSKQVKFSQGNLQYQASSQTWRLAELQFSQICKGNVQSVHQDWIDLFVMSTSTTNFGTRMSDEITSWDDYLPDFIDWGTLKLKNSSLNGWRTLTREEWMYLLHQRDNAEEKLFHATISGVKGHVLLPDNWVCPVDISIVNTYYRNQFDNYDVNQFSKKEWRKLQANGAVFLPCKEETQEQHYFERNNQYWTSTITNYPKRPYSVAFYVYSENYIRSDYENSIISCSVRLVQDIK